MYYNTTNQKGDQLKVNKVLVDTQNKLIKDYFIKYIQSSPSSIYRQRIKLGLGDIPITSIRRSITNLTESGFLIKTDLKTIGLYGREEYIWKLV
jgi:hypothetical protein